MLNKAALVIAGLLINAAAAGAEPLNEEKPFAEQHVILQVSQADPDRHSLTLDIANNLTKHYGGPDTVDIEVVAFAAGAPMLFADNPNRIRIESLMAQGVRFYICGNTLDTIERRERKRPTVLDGVETVQTGVAFMIEEMEKGYTHVQP